MTEHPIEGLMQTAMNSIKDMIDVNTIIGDPIETSSGIVIIPISKVCFGFASGGSEFKGETIDEYKKKDKEEQVQYRLPFGGGSGAGISINPVAFVVVSKETIKILPIEHNSAIEKLMDYVPELMEKANGIAEKTIEKKNDKTKVQVAPKNKIIKNVKNVSEEGNDKSEERNDKSEDSINIEEKK